ncbi:MAG: hypothetical protein IJS97_05600 [Prevotella sp.]|nr:hypothetical protein [Prevotella sp.]
MRRFLWCACMVGALTFTVACGSDSSSNDPLPETPDKPDTPNDPDSPENPDQPSADVTFSEAEQKQKLDAAARELLGYISASDFYNVRDVAKYARAHYLGKNYSTINVKEWAEECLDAITSLKSEVQSDNTYYQDYERLWMAANFTGEFSAGETGWIYTPNDNHLQFKFKDQNGQVCIARLTTSGSVYTVHHQSFDNQRVEYNYSSWTRTVSRFRNVVGVPQNINITITQGGTEIVSAQVKTSVSTGAEVNFTTDSYSVELTTKVAGYEFQIEKASYQSGKSAAVNFNLKKGGTQLVSAKVSAEGTVNNEPHVERIGQANVSVDVLGKVQVKGECSNVSQFMNHIKVADKHSEADFKARVEQANTLLNAAVYYDGNSARSATLKVMAFEDEYGYGNSEWKAEPVIVFSDGTSYNTFGKFFSKDNFRVVYNTVMDLLGDFKEMVEEFK